MIVLLPVTGLDTRVKLKLVQINRSDVTGGRFNGYALRDLLAQRGVDSTHLVWDKTIDDPRVKRLLPFPGSRALNHKLHEMERKRSMHAVMSVQSFALPMQKEFKEADVVHYHIIHDGYFSLPSLPYLSRLKPSVWTWHDPWPMTGHCIYPMGCEKWKTGCGECPDLSLHFSMKEDRTREAAAMKQRVMQRADIDIIVASEFMGNMARRSFVGKEARLHHIPFGLDLNLYREGDRAAARAKLGIPEENVVICLRAISSTFKGLREFVDAVTHLETTKPVTILSFQESGYFNHLIGRHQIVEMGWVSDDATMITALTAADIFAMPSTAEAFGLMAIEAMACSKPVVVFEGTSLPEVVFAPHVGVAVPMKDSKALSQALKRLIENPEERARRSFLSREIAEKHYGVDLFIDRLVRLYSEVAERRLIRKRAG